MSSDICGNKGCHYFEVNEPNNCRTYNMTGDCTLAEYICPFCNDSGYSKLDLHTHLDTGDCDAYNNMK